MNDVFVNSGIEIRHVTKSFGHTKALDDVNVSFAPERIYGLLGQNGAGKSTLLNLISNRLFPDSGDILVDGETARENDRAQSKIYLMSEKTLYYEDMKLRDTFKWSAHFYPDFDMDGAMKLAEMFKLKLNKKVKSLSTGYTSIFKLIIALSVNTPYLFLDEPVLGLDANHRDIFYKYLLEKYIEKPCTIVISTHLIEEVASLIEDVVIIKDGRIIEDTSKDELLTRGFTISGRAADVDAYMDQISRLHDPGKQILGADSLGSLKTAYILGDRSDVPGSLDISSMNLQKLFIQLTNAMDTKEVQK